MAGFKTYSFSNGNAIFGITEIQGFAEGADCINIEVETDQFLDMAGAKGDVVRTQTNDNRCTITLKLLQVSESNKDLNNIYIADKETGLGVFPFIYQDKELKETYLVNNAWITKAPVITRGQTPNPMVWVLRGDFLTITIDE